MRKSKRPEFDPSDTSPEALEAYADALLAWDNDESVLSENQLRKIRAREIYDPTGTPRQIEPGVFSRQGKRSSRVDSLGRRGRGKIDDAE